MRRIPLLLGVILMLSPWCWAADDDWNNLSRLKPGDRVDVVQTSKATATGMFRDSSVDGIVLTVDGAQRSIPKNDVVRISRKGKTHRLRNGILLGVAGAVIGAGSFRFGLACAETNDGCDNTKIATFAGAGVGAAIGAAIPARSALIYRISKLPSP